MITYQFFLCNVPNADTRAHRDVRQYRVVRIVSGLCVVF